MPATVLSIVLMLSLSAALAWGLSIAGGIFPSMILATAPGGIAEMSTTARALRLGVALVIAAHVTPRLDHRYVVVAGVSVAAAEAQKKLFAPQERQ